MRTLRAGWARTPLRVRLVAAMLGLLAAAILASGGASVTLLRSYLVDRVDTQLEDASRMAVNDVMHGRGLYENGRPLPGGEAGTTYVVQANGADGSLLDEGDTTDGDASPDLPKLDAAAVTALGDAPYTVGSATGGGEWRVITEALPNGESVTVALSLDSVQSTTDRLMTITAAVGGAVLLLLAVVAYVLVRSSLRPLVGVERTAEAIAAGNLSHRVPEGDPRTEVGRLAQSFNSMLGQIEAAFRAREESETEARASEERMRRFVGDASHELRTPLTSIRGYAELYRQGAAAEPADVARAFRRVEDEARRMGLLVDDLLLLARLDQQRPLDQRPVDLLTLATEGVGDMRVVAPDRRIELEVIGTPDRVPVVVGDEARLRQVLGNLLANATSHTPAGTPITVRVGTTNDADGPHAFLEVADQGPGLDDEAAAQVFERFYRGDASRSRAAGGTGLGLSIAAALIAAHGGRITLQTSPGAGATFRVQLPLAPEPVGAAEAKPSPATSQVATRVSTS